MTTTATPTAPPPKGVAVPAKAVVEKVIELKDLRRNPEGIVSVDPKEIEATQHCTVVSSRLFLGYGGPLAIEDAEGRGLFKALGDDIIYELSDGNQYVLPHNLAEALGVTVPPPAEAEVAAMAGKLDEFEAKEREKAAKQAEADKRAAEANKPKPVVPPTHTPPAAPPPTHKVE